VLYLGANLAYALVLTPTELVNEKNKVTVAAFGRALLGPAGLAAASAAVMVSTFGALAGSLLVGPRLLYAMGEDRLAPRVLGEVHARYRTPAVAILVLAGWAAFLVVAVGLLGAVGVLDPAKRDYFDVLTNFVVFGAVVFETLALSTIFVFRRRLPGAERPYRCPGYPWVPAAYILVMALVLVTLFVESPVESFAGLGFIAAGVGVYYLFFHRGWTA
jgi:basic amino acid/polyamine antiporter, APA family